MTGPYLGPMRWMRRRGDRVRIITSKYAGRSGNIKKIGFGYEGLEKLNPRIVMASVVDNGRPGTLI